MSVDHPRALTDIHKHNHCLPCPDAEITRRIRGTKEPPRPRRGKGGGGRGERGPHPRPGLLTPTTDTRSMTNASPSNTSTHSSSWALPDNTRARCAGKAAGYAETRRRQHTALGLHAKEKTLPSPRHARYPAHGAGPPKRDHDANTRHSPSGAHLPASPRKHTGRGFPESLLWYSMPVLHLSSCPPPQPSAPRKGPCRRVAGASRFVLAGTKSYFRWT